jgi:hypothetical protein
LLRNPSGDGIKGRDVAVAELADQDGIAELPKVLYCPGNSPGSIHGIGVLQTLEQPTMPIEYIHEPTRQL